MLSTQRCASRDIGELLYGAKAGASGVINDLLVGPVQVAFVNAASAAGSIEAGTLRPLAVVNRDRLASLPNVPTTQEAGFTGVGTIAWQGLFAHSAVPRSVLEKLLKAAAQALGARRTGQGLQSVLLPPVPPGSLP